MITAVALSALLSFAPVAKKPSWFETTVAGYSFAYDATHSSAQIFDPVSKFMLIRMPECDGADMTLLLTRDRYMVAEMGFKVPNFKPTHGENGTMEMTVKALPSLSTKKGIKMGASTAAVKAKLGKPTKSFITGPRQQFLNYQYAFTEGKADSGVDYEQTYTFKEGKLIEIMFTWGPSENEDKAEVRQNAQKTQKDPKRGG